jgi:spore germination protein KC
VIRRLLFIILIIINIFTLSGCWDAQQLDNLAVVTGIALEKGSEGRIRIIIQAVNTQAVSADSGASGLTFQKAYQNKAVEGYSLYEAFDNIRFITSTQQFYSHLGVIIIAEDLARERGMTEFLDYFERNAQSRLDSWVLIGRGDLTELMDSPGGIRTIPTQRIQARMETLPTPPFAALQLAEFIKLMQNESLQPYTAGVENKASISAADEPGHGILDGNVPDPLYDITVNGTAVFRQDKLVGWLDKEESRGLQWLRGQVSQVNRVFENPDHPGKRIGVYIVSAKTRLEPQIRNGQIVMQVNLEVQSYLQESQGKANWGETSALSRLEAAQGEQIKREVEAALQKGQQEYQTDIFGFGQAVHRNYPEEWKLISSEWSEIFPAVPVEIQVKSTIRHTSLITQPAEPAPK